MKENPADIDIVLPWVNGADPSWREQFDRYTKTTEGDKREIRFRDWDLLRYWFRSVELYAPWVRKIHFVTSGELPEWLNINHPKLNWVKHSDFMPVEYLPTFNINAIEVNIHRIKGLSEHFIYFNDDMFLLKEAQVSDFFRNGLPCDCAILDPIVPKEGKEIYVNGIQILNEHFNKTKVVRANLSKWINFRYGSYLLKTFLLLPWKQFPGILGAHLPQAFNKSTFQLVWEKEHKLLHATSSSKLKTYANVNQWLFRYWHLAEGMFAPSNTMNKGKSFEITNLTIDTICKFIRAQKMKQICINDTDSIADFEAIQNKLDKAFLQILPEKSQYEK